MKTPSFLIVSVILIALLAIADYQFGKLNKLKSEKAILSVQLSEQIALITNQQERIKHLAELDKVHTQELTNAKSKI
ncbi:lysis system i-spanin subunit Rz, partial [Xenorhabdus littoralis]|uniref:lysis system i-spanin subunit Rz n=1 Tax=Xenorhabdus littoralis TaxID=2582835 RepID=UPI0029EFDA78|nr:lysis protein [Xenorhabdus sp. psl]